jgi:metallopeptidase MepB
MAKTAKSVDEFLGDLRTRLQKGGAEEMAGLKRVKEAHLKAHGLPYDGHYYAWDHRYYSRIQEEQDFKIDQLKLAEYFPIQEVLARMLAIFEQLMGLRFVEVVGADRAAISPTGRAEDIVWHPDVQIFSVWNDEGQGGDFVGYLYTDMHPRDGKYGLRRCP